MKHDPAQICREGSGRFDGLHIGGNVRNTRASLFELVITAFAVGFMSTLAVAAVLVWLIGG